MPADPPADAIRLLLAGAWAVMRGSLLGGREGIELVGAAATDADTIRLARRTRPDVVLIDSTNGLHVLATARRLLAEPDHAEVILLGRFEREGDVLAALHSGIGGLVDKDAEPDELARAVRMSAGGAAFILPAKQRGFSPRLAPSRRTRERVTSITAGERDAVALAVRGHRDEAIAAQLAISVPTVRSRLSSAMRKLGARDRSALVIAAYEAGLLQPPSLRPDPNEE
jgi:DNA-binding NarL/FixJ family response regulator